MKTSGERVIAETVTYKNWYLDDPTRVKATVKAPYYPSATFKSTAGVRTPGFEKLRRSGALLPFTPFAQVEEAWEAGGTSWDLSFPGTNTITRNSTPLTAFDLSGRVLPCKGADPEVLYTQLMAKMGSPEWDGLTFVAELRKCIVMFREILPKLRDFIKRYDKDRVVDMYLEVRYGLRPIVYDMMAINNAILALGDEPRNFIRKRVESVDQDVSVYEVPWGSITYTVTASTVVSSRMAGVSSVIPPVVGVNPVVTIWEITRLSFLIDWIVDVGTFLQGLTSLSAYGQTLCGLGHLVTSQVSITGARITDPTKAYGSVTMGGSYIVQTTSRSPYSGRSMSIPLQFDIDFWKVVDIVFLAKSLTRISRRNPPKGREFYYRSKRPINLPDIIYR